jgi:predicted transposase YdaD
MNHDALFKMLLKSPAILRGFFDAFLPDVAKFVDFNVLEFVDKERLTIEGRKRTGDLLIKTRFRGEAAAFLIHLEHQAQPDPGLGRRMLEYFMLDWRDFELPVYPIAVLSHKEPPQVRLTPVRVDFPNGWVLRFKFDVIDLGRMQADSYLQLPNPAALALAARMKLNPTERVRLTRDLFIKLAQTPIGQEDKELVAGFFSEYQRLSIREALQLEREMSKVSLDMTKEKVIQLTNPFIELGIIRGRRQGRQEGLQKGIHRGRQEGRQQGEVDLVLRMLRRRFGALTASQERAIRKLNLSRIEALGEALLEFTSRSDLARWLRPNS